MLKSIPSNPNCFGHIGTGAQLPAGHSASVVGNDVMESDPPVLIGKNSFQQLDETAWNNVQSGLFQGFSDHRVFQSLTNAYQTSWDGPISLGRRGGSTNENDP